MKKSVNKKALKGVGPFIPGGYLYLTHEPRGRKWCERLMKKLQRGNLLRVDDVKLFAASLDPNRCDVDQVTKAFIYRLLSSYRRYPAFFLRYNANFALKNCCDDLIKFWDSALGYVEGLPRRMAREEKKNKPETPPHRHYLVFH